MKISLRLLAFICILAGGAGVARARNQDDTLSAQVDEVVRAQMREQKIPGVSLGVMRDGKVIKATGYGLANVELNVPVTSQSVFHTESVGKTFTAVGVLILVEEGKVGLDDKITKYIPESPTAWRDVTVRQLLTHTSGIPDYLGEFDGKGLVDLQKNYTEDEVIQIVAHQPLDFQPGEKRVYSNSGYVILGALIHHVTGKNWADFLQERLFVPLGMTSTRVISESDIIPNRTSGYHLVHGKWKNTDWVAPSLNTLADGTLYTNVLDMAKWDEALSTEKILKRTTLDQMWIPIELNSGKTFPQGLCFRIDDVNGHRLAWKDGVWQGYTTIMSRYLDDHLTIIVLTNLGEDATLPLHIAERVAAIYIPALGKSNRQPPPAVAAHETDESSKSNQRTDQQLSSQQEEVWKGEQDYQQPPTKSNDKAAVEATVRAYEEAVQVFDFARADSLLAQNAKWIERSAPEAAAFGEGTGFWAEAKATKIRVRNEPHDFDIHLQGQMAWVTLLVDVTMVADNERARALLARSETQETGKTSEPDQREWRATYTESEVLVRTPNGWRIALGHTSRLPTEPDLQPTSTPHSAEAQVLELDRAWGQAYVKGDIDVIDRTLAPDWRGWLHAEGSDKAQQKERTCLSGRQSPLPTIFVAKCILCFHWLTPRTIVHSNPNPSDICTVRAQFLLGSLEGKARSTVESQMCVKSGRSAAW